jgi:hypothetical protein
VILGHSFIRRLRDFVHSSEDNNNLRLREGDIFVSFHARGGLTIYRLANTLAVYNFNNQDVCFLQLGSNDLSDPTKAVSKIGLAIFSFANFSCGFGIIGQSLRRSPRVTDSKYNDKRHRTEQFTSFIVCYTD